MAGALTRSGDRPERTAAVVGAGWAGLAAAVRLRSLGWRVTLFEAASTAGGRARSVRYQGQTLDNGQHILIGAYRHTLALMQEVGVDPDAVLQRSRLGLVNARGQGLRLPGGPALPAFAWGVWKMSHWPMSSRLAWLGRTSRWLAGGMRCPPTATVADLCAGLPPEVMSELIDPLCVAALNTDSREASAMVFLRVLRDALFSGPGSADLLLPRRPLGELLPEPALTWLEARGTQLRWRHSVQLLSSEGPPWRVDGEAFGAVVLASPAWEAARLVEPLSPAWSSQAAALMHEPIVTLTLETSAAGDGPWCQAMVRLDDGPAQFAFDLQALGHPNATSRDEDGRPHRRFTFVASAASAALKAGATAFESAVLAQARKAFPELARDASLRIAARFSERRATFLCSAGLRRPPARIAPALYAAGDYVDGPYPATLEGAVRSGLEAARAIESDAGRDPRTHRPAG